MTPLFVLAQKYADATRPRTADNARPDAPVIASRRARWPRARRRARQAPPR
jgi:hypothetical protein